MLKQMTKIFAPPIFPEDEEKTRKAGYANAIALTFLVIVFVAEISLRASGGLSGLSLLDIILVIFFTVVFISWIFLKRGYVRFISIMLVVAIWVAANGYAATAGGVRDSSYISNFSIVVLTGLLLGWRASLVVTVTSVLSGFGIAIAEEQGLILIATYPPASFATDMTVIFGLNTVLLYLLIYGLENEIKKSKTSLKELQLTNINLHSAQANLKKRTTELEQRGLEVENANQKVQRRTLQFEALAQVTQNITALRDLQELLPRITTLISDKFHFYHVGIFLLDSIDQYAILVAANSAGGKRMLARNHRLRVGEEGIVGYTTARGKPHIAMDVGADAVYFNNPDLPDTHSEMALPLISKNIIVGALDVQSTETAAFTDEDIQMLSLLADQVSLAIENARIFDESRKALAESEIISRRTTRDAWDRLPEQQKLLGYRYNVSGASPLKELVKIAEPDLSKSKGSQAETTQAVVPIELRGQVIGTLVVQSPIGNEWTADQLDLIKAVADRVALSAENARLFEETTARAEREKLVSDITSKIRSHNDPQSMIQTAINELRSALGATQVEVIPQSIKGAERNEA